MNFLPFKVEMLNLVNPLKLNLLYFLWNAEAIDTLQWTSIEVLDSIMKYMEPNFTTDFEAKVKLFVLY